MIANESGFFAEQSMFQMLLQLPSNSLTEKYICSHIFIEGDFDKLEYIEDFC